MLVETLFFVNNRIILLMISILTFNAAIQDVRILGQSMYRPLNAIDSRLAELINQLKLIDADIVCLQEIYHSELQHKLYSAVQSVYPHAIGFAMNLLNYAWEVNY